MKRKHYDSSFGVRLPSVTHIIKATDPNQRYFQELQANYTKEKKVALEKKRASSAQRGTKIHAQIEGVMDHLLKRSPVYVHQYIMDCKLLDDPWLGQLEKPLLEDLQWVWGTEVYLESTKGYAGTADLIVQEQDGTLAVWDFKTSSKRKKKEWLSNYWLQLAAYAQALYEAGEPVSKIRIVNMVQDAKKASNFVLQDEKMWDWIEKFNRRLDIFWQTYHV